MNKLGSTLLDLLTIRRKARDSLIDVLASLGECPSGWNVLKQFISYKTSIRLFLQDPRVNSLNAKL